LSTSEAVLDSGTLASFKLFMISKVVITFLVAHVMVIVFYLLLQGSTDNLGARK